MPRRVRRVSRSAMRLAVGAVLLPLALPLAAQGRVQASAAWEAGGALSRAPVPGAESPGAWTDDGRLGAALRVGGALGALSLDGMAGLHDGGWHGAGRVAGLAASPAWRGLRLSVAGEARRAAAGTPSLLPFGTLDAPSWPTATDLRARDRASGEARLGWARGGGGLWVGADAAWNDRRRQSAVGRGSTTALASLVRPRAERVAAGAWRQLGGLVVGVSFGSRAYRVPGTPTSYRVDSVANGTRIRADSSGPTPRIFVDTIWREVRDSAAGTPARSRRWSELEARVGWARGRVTLDAAAGLRPRVPGAASATWMEGAGSVAVGARAALVATAGTLPPAAGIRGTTATHLTLGLRLAPRALHRALLPPVVRTVPTDFEVRAAAAGTHVFSVRLPGARAVELSGDFTGWKPVALRQVAADRWEVALAVAAGTHRCNVRVDGDRWVAPPGTTAVDDDFNGQVGLIVVP